MSCYKGLDAQMNREMKIQEITAYYPKFEKIIFKWSHRHLSRFYKEGFRWCVSCNFLVKTEERLCRKCKNAMRTTIRNKRGFNIPYTVSKDSPIIIDKVNGVVI